VTLGLRIHHFSYLSQPSVSKICSFINSYICPSLSWAFGKIFTAFTLQVLSHIFFLNKAFVSRSLNLFFQRKARSYFFPKHVGFLVNQFIFILFFFLTKLISAITYVFFSFLKSHANEGTQGLPTSR